MVRRSTLPVVMFLLWAFSACATTRFPENPEAHRLFAELEAADPYYFNVRAGLATRLLGIMPEENARATMSSIRARWSEIDRIESAPGLTNFFNQANMAAVVERIEATLLQNEPDAPAAGIDARLQAAALKQGMVDAALEFESAVE